MGQDYKALTVVNGSLPRSFVKRGVSSAEALEVMSKNRTAVYPLLPPCPVLHSVLFAPESLMLSFFFYCQYLFSLHILFVLCSPCVRPVSAYGHREAILLFFF